MVRHGEGASPNKDAAEKFVEKFQDLWIERDLFPNKYSIVTRQTSSGKKKCQTGPTSQEKRRLVFMEYDSPSKQ